MGLYMPSRFIRHESCPQCGSKDNLGVWDDGHKYCFGCKYQEGGKVDIRTVFSGKPPEDYKMQDFPYDASEEMPFEPLSWMLKCGLTFTLQREYGIQWSSSRKMLCWKIKGLKGTIIGWQGRCFAKDAKTKYFTQGKIHEDICILSSDFPMKDVVVLVEDYISAIRVAQYYPAMPLFGCTCSVSTLNALSKRFKNIVVWLDADKLDNARKIGLNASMVWLKSNVVYTPKDPKEYTATEIETMLKGA